MERTSWGRAIIHEFKVPPTERPNINTGFVSCRTFCGPLELRGTTKRCAVPHHMPAWTSAKYLYGASSSFCTAYGSRHMLSWQRNGLVWTTQGGTRKDPYQLGGGKARVQPPALSAQTHQQGLVLTCRSGRKEKIARTVRCLRYVCDVRNVDFIGAQQFISWTQQSFMDTPMLPQVSIWRLGRVARAGR